MIDVFSNSDYEYTLLPDGSAEIKKYHGNGAELSIPDTLDGKRVTSIGYRAFSDCQSVTGVTIPDCVRNIDSAAFADCGSLEVVTIPEGVTSIGIWAFSHCTSLKNVTIPNSVTKIAEGVFSGCDHLQCVSFLNRIDTIPSFTFRFCTHLTRIMLPSGLKKIGQSAFLNCCELEEIELPSSLESIAEIAFFRCKKLRKVVLPDSVSFIGKHAFTQCDQLHAISIRGKTNPCIQAFLRDWENQRETVILYNPYWGRVIYEPLDQPDDGMGVYVYNGYVDWGKEKPAVKSIVDVQVKYPFCCAKGDLFVSSFGQDEFIQGRLLEILSMYISNAVIRAEVVSIGNPLSFVKRLSKDAIDKLEQQDYKIQPLAYKSGIEVRFSAINDKMFCLSFIAYGGSDMWLANLIYTDEDGVDHIVQSSNNDYEINIIKYGDEVIGLHKYCPFGQGRRSRPIRPESPEYENLLPRYITSSSLSSHQRKK